MRRAYLALLTSFIMTGCTPGGSNDPAGAPPAEGNMPSMTGVADPGNPLPPLTGERKEQVVKYMLSEAGMPGRPVSGRAVTLYNGLVVGMSESLLDEQMQSVALEKGYVWTDGGKRVYYRIDDDHQVWFDVRGDENGHVVRIGPIETKQEWKKYENDVIIIDDDDTVLSP